MVGPPPTSPTPIVWGTQMTWIHAICVLRYEAATVTPHSLQLTRVFFRSLKVAPSPIAHRLYAVLLHFTHMNLGVVEKDRI